ncbi:GNAT family N-acetyltransferase [Paenibacillus sp. sgz500958]|uniref:GNAT family N-acetyltransferase n=1 Tax=Paenibacillus sp. sgz500958 TaxID=3242475 RepID=UPI0036D288A7
MILETERLIIREFVREDVHAVHTYASDPAVAVHMIWGPNTLEETEGFINWVMDIQQSAPRKAFEFAVVLKEGNQLIGGCGIHTGEPREGEIGYCFNQQYWRQGYGNEAARTLLEFGFCELGLHRIYATCRPDNIGSAKVMQSIGMTYEGHLREHKWHKGRWNDSYLYAILEQDYKPLA